MSDYNWQDPTNEADLAARLMEVERREQELLNKLENYQRAQNKGRSAQEYADLMQQATAEIEEKNLDGQGVLKLYKRLGI